LEKVTLMEAYVIETIRHAGFTNKEMMIKIENRQLDDFQKLDESLDFTVLYSLVENNWLKSILEDGYTITFLTFPGLINLLKLKYNKHRDKDFDVSDFVISKLQLNKEQMADLETWLSANWKIKKEKEGIGIKPVHI